MIGHWGMDYGLVLGRSMGLDIWESLWVVWPGLWFGCYDLWERETRSLRADVKDMASKWL